MRISYRLLDLNTKRSILVLWTFQEEEIILFKGRRKNGVNQMAHLRLVATEEDQTVGQPDQTEQTEKTI